MKTPGFTAEASLHDNHARLIGADHHDNECLSQAVIPQFSRAAASAPCNCYWVTLHDKFGLPVYSYFTCDCKRSDPSSIPNRGLFG